MIRVVTTLTALIACVRVAEASSVPVQCEKLHCEEGSMCTVIRSEPCNNRWCPPPSAQCVPVSSKDGICPNRLENRDCLSLQGVPLCWTDEDCPDRQKCCDGCCKTPEAEMTTEERIAILKAGACPENKIEDAFRRWWTALFCEPKEVVDACLTDMDCPGNDKCCLALCGNECSPAIHIVAGSRTQPKNEEGVIPQVPLVNTNSSVPLEPEIEPTRPPRRFRLHKPS
ncbi:whey acidic protein-like [Liolophura sinensis]|uniref:whey acidic protein-like n=1 Tax=Liolophura sinensis TaxID=3198878 RepID=UPI003158A65A